MAKRFTDTDKWKLPWYQELGPLLRDVRQFILDDCDLAGIWTINLARLSFYVGEKISMDDVRKAFNGQVSVLSDEHMFIESFIKFQYGNLSPACKPHISVIKALEKMGITLDAYTQNKGLAKGYLTLKDKDKDKDKDKEKEKEKEKDKEGEGFSEFKRIRNQINRGTA